MKHLDEATLVSLRDGEHVDDDESLHLESCARCAEAVEEVDRRRRRIEEILASLDPPAIGGEDARSRTRERLDRRTGRPAAGAPWWRPVHMGRAAAVLLVAAGAVSALPGSPVRQWISGPTEPTPGAEDPEAAPMQNAQPASVTVTVGEGGLRVMVGSLGPLDQLEVLWIGGSAARVEAPAGSRFTYAEGRVEALVAGGPVRIELPRAGPPVSVEVDGAPYLSRSGDEVRVDGPVSERSDDRILFVAP